MSYLIQSCFVPSTRIEKDTLFSYILFLIKCRRYVTSVKYSRSVFTSVDIFSSSTSIWLLGQKTNFKCILGLIDWWCALCQDSLDMILFFAPNCNKMFSVTALCRHPPKPSSSVSMIGLNTLFSFKLVHASSHLPLLVLGFTREILGVDICFCVF